MRRETCTHDTPLDPERTVRRHVHLALAGAALAFLAPLLTWGLWLLDRRAPPGPWKRRLLALAIVDAVLVLALVAGRASGLDVEPPQEPPHIGVALDPRDTTPGVLVDEVAPNSPAARASLQEGDRIVAIDDHTVTGASDFARETERTPSGVARSMTVVRNGRSFDVSVTPEVGAPLPARRAGSLFEGIRHGSARPSHSFMVGAGSIDLLVVLALMLVARRRGAPAGAGVAVIAGLLALAGVSSAVLVAFGATLGISLGAVLVALLAGSLALLVTDLVAGALLHPPALRVGPPLTTSRAISLGALYGFGGAARLAIAVALVASIAHVPLRGAAGAFGLSLSWGVMGVSLFVIATVIVAPVAEELLFRGILLPWLGRFMSPKAALVSSAFVFGIGHLYYGLGALLIGFYGLVLGWARMRTGRIGASIALHALLNGTTAVALLLQSRQ